MRVVPPIGWHLFLMTTLDACICSVVIKNKYRFRRLISFFDFLSAPRQDERQRSQVWSTAQVDASNEINIVILRRGNREDECCNHSLCPDVRIYCCFSSLRVVILRISSAVNKGRSPQNCILTECVSVRFAVAILRDDEVYIASIKNNTRDTVGGRVSGWHKKTK